MNTAIAAVLLAPRSAAVLVLRAYRAVISPLYGDVCRYYPSCSAYTLQAIQQHGVVVGSVLGIRRIARCHPWAAGGVDDVPPAKKPRYRVTPFGFVVASSSNSLIGHGKA
ncbi:membrane protein insertion efficiency factor YidD [Leifsonia sp. L25]|uniref:membrane protein insertion efficiency factor YidD n=1 Tax=Leifsonia sp. L25 TaxID=3423957 RepID=UPI003D68EC20